jgi:hypothetical protein
MGQVVSKMAGKKKKQYDESSIKPKMARGGRRYECLSGNWYVDLLSIICLLHLLEDPLYRGGHACSELQQLQPQQHDNNKLNNIPSRRETSFRRLAGLEKKTGNNAHLLPPGGRVEFTIIVC